MQKRSGHHRLTLIVMIMMLWFLTANTAASQAENQINGTLYFNTLDGAVYAWKVQLNSASLIVDYEYQFDRPSGWSSVTFSSNGDQLAYVRTDGDKRWVGVSRLDKWQPNELAIDVHFDYQKVYLNWLPNNTQIIVSFLIDIPKGQGQPAMYNTLVGRQLLDTTNFSHGLSEFPYTCAELVVASLEQRSALQCSINNDLNITDETLPRAIWYDFAQGELIQKMGDNPLHSFRVQDFIYPNWVWSKRSGLALFDNGSHSLPNGVNLLPTGSTQPSHLETPVTLFGTISWSPDGTRLLVQDNDLRIWHIYDTSGNQVNSPVNIPDLNLQAGVVWFRDSDHIAYVTEEGQKSTIHIKSLSSNSDVFLQIENAVTALAAPQL